MVRTSLAVALFLVASCGTRSGSPVVAPPSAEFLVATQDSTFWLRSAAAGVRFRGAPLTVATFGGRFYEIFLADDDRSYSDALLVGTRVYRRDLVDGDSLLIFQDTIVPRLAGEYARAHPGMRPLAPEEEEEADPPTQVTSDLRVVGLHGPYLSYEYHVDVTLAGREPWHATRRGVLDLRTGRAARVADLAPDSAAAILAAGRRRFRAAVDSLRESAGAADEASSRALAAVSRLRFDEQSFVLVTDDSDLAVEFDVPERGTDVPDDVVPLTSITVPTPDWWAAVRPRHPESLDELDRWPRLQAAGYDLLARYDSTSEVARLSLSDSSRREWPIHPVSAPILQVVWLDRPAVDSVQRRALTRAFDEATLYGESTRTVEYRPSGHGRVPRRFLAPARSAGHRVVAASRTAPTVPRTRHPAVRA